MKACWETIPEERPRFRELVKSIDHLKGAEQKPPMLKKQSAAYLPVHL